jgi:hypothetical protein
MGGVLIFLGVAGLLFGLVGVPNLKFGREWPGYLLIFGFPFLLIVLGVMQHQLDRIEAALKEKAGDKSH